MQTSRTIRMALLCSGILAAPSIALAAVGNVKEIEKAKLSMADAIAAAEKTSGGKAMEVDLIEKDNLPVFDVTLVKGDDTVNYTVNAGVATATAVKSERVTDKLAVETKEDRTAALASKVSLKEAVAKVEKTTGGKAMEADTEVSDNAAEYVIDVALNGESVEKKVNAATGMVVAEK